MSIETSTINASQSASQVAITSKSADNSKKTTTDSSFKEEMEKVSTTQDKKTEKVDKKESKTEVKKSEKISDAKSEKKVNIKSEQNENSNFNQNISINVTDANNMLSNDIEQMMLNKSRLAEVNSIRGIRSDFSMYDNSKTNTISISENDAQFFLNLTRGENVNVQNMTLQAQNMINNGANVSEVKQSFQVSQTLLDAINKAKETNQPLRLDFDKNVSVILRIGKDGVVSANFIPGDKAVEQYLRNNISNLRATFEENDLPYRELSYSNSNKGQSQNERRKNTKQQGDNK